VPNVAVVAVVSFISTVMFEAYEPVMFVVLTEML